MKPSALVSFFLSLVLVTLAVYWLTIPKLEAYSLDVFAMSTFVSFTIYSGDEEEAKDLLARSSELLYQIENKFSTTLEYSPLYQINHGDSSQWHEIDNAMIELVLFSQEMAEETNGAFDPTIYPLVLAWGFTQEEERIPSQSEIDSLLPLVGVERVILTETNTLNLPQGMGLDFGGIAKGYACDLIAMLWKASGVSGTISLGGNVHAIGLRPDGENWNIGIQHPEDGGVLASVQVSDLAVVTSGGYQRFFEVDGVTYSHILDPKTGRPADTDLTSVTIICEDATYADALSTALFVMGREDAISHWNSHQDFEMVLVDASGEVTITPSLSFTINPDYQEGEVTTLG